MFLVFLNFINRDSKSFCSDHSGIISSDDEVMKLIENSFDKNTLNLIYSNFEDFFLLYTKILFKYEIGKEIKNNPENNQDLRKLIVEMLNYLNDLASNNLAILLIISEFFGRQQKDFTTNHICSLIQVKNNEVKFEFIYNNKIDCPSECKCFFLTNLLRVWNKDMDKELKLDKIFVNFLKSYKFKVLYSFSYFSLIDIIIKNNSEQIKHLSVQVVTIENIAEQLAKSDNLIFNFFEKFKDLTEEYLKSENSPNKMDELFNIILEFYSETNYLTKTKPAKILSQKFYILKIIIDILSLIENQKKMKISKTFKYEGYDQNFLYIEYYLLQIFSLLISIMDFSDYSITNEMIFYLIDKIVFEDYKIKLEKDEFSFHIPLHRALAMLLNRVCFNYQDTVNIEYSEALRLIIYKYYDSLSEFDVNNNFIDNNISNNNLDLIKSDSVEEANKISDMKNENNNYSQFSFESKKSLDNQDNKKIFFLQEEMLKKKHSSSFTFEEILKKILMNNLKCISFLNSIACDKWVFYGENMNIYNIIYYVMELFSLSDFTLNKIILILDKENSIFNFKYFLTSTNFDNIYSDFLQDYSCVEKFFDVNFLKEKIENLKNLDHKSFNFLVKNLEYFLKLFTSNNNQLKLLFFSLKVLNDNRTEDKAFENFVLREKNNLKNLLKDVLLHIIFSKENSTFFSDIKKGLPYFLKKIFSEENIENILSEITDIFHNKNKPDSFKIKPEFYVNIDLFSYLDPQTKSNAEKYFLEFMKEKFCIINTPENTILDWEKNFYHKFFDNFFYHSIENKTFNFEYIYNILLILISNNKTFELNNTFMYIFMKFFCIFLKYYKKIDETKKVYFKEFISNQKFLDAILENSILKTPFNISCKYLNEKVEKICPKIIENNLLNRTNDGNSGNNFVSQNKGRSRQELLKLQYSMKSEKALKKFSTQSENENNQKDIVNFSNKTDSQSNKILSNDINLNLNEENYFNNDKAKKNSLNDLKNNVTNIKNNQNNNEINILSNTEIQNDVIDCIICKNILHQNEMYTNPYGKIGILNSSSLIYNSKLQTIKQEFENVIFNNKFNEFPSNSVINNLKSNIMMSNISNNNINSNLGIFDSSSNNNNIFNSEISNQENIDIEKKDSQIFFSQINSKSFEMNIDESVLLKDIMLNFNKTKKELKKSLRYSTCNHYIHFTCFSKIITKYLLNNFKKQIMFVCPLCKSVSNCVFPELDINVKYQNPKTKEIEDIYDGFTFEEIFKFLNDKKEKELEIEYLNTHLNIQDIFGNMSIPKEFINCSEDFIEKIISNNNKFIISDFNVKKQNHNNIPLIMEILIQLLLP